MLLILENVKNVAYEQGNWLLTAGVLSASLEETKSEPAAAKLLCETRCLMLAVHACPFHDTISGLLILHYLFVPLNSKPRDTFDLHGLSK